MTLTKCVDTVGIRVLFRLAFERINNPRNPTQREAEKKKDDKDNHAVLIETSEGDFPLWHANPPETTLEVQRCVE